MKPSNDRRKLSGIFTVAVLVTGVCAHILIDVVGDFLLPFDTYDHIAHASREAILISAVAICAILTMRAFGWLCEMGTSCRLRVVFMHVTPQKIAAFIACLVLGTLLVVPAMELLDAVLARRDVDALSDLYGGSIALGTACSFLCAAIIGAIAAAIVAWIGAYRDSLVILAMRLLRSLVTPHSYERATRLLHAVASSSLLLGRRTRKRGPPLNGRLPILVH